MTPRDELILSLALLLRWRRTMLLVALERRGDTRTAAAQIIDDLEQRRFRFKATGRGAAHHRTP